MQSREARRPSLRRIAAVTIGMAVALPTLPAAGVGSSEDRRVVTGDVVTMTLPLPEAVGPTDGPQVSDAAAGTIETLAGGSADGAAPRSSTFFQPWHALAAPDGSIVVVDTHNNRIRAYDPRGGPVRTIAGTGDAGFSGDGGPATEASLNFPMGATFGPDGDLYIGDTWNDRVRRVDRETGVITTIAGIGVGDDPDDPPACGTGVGGPATEAVTCDPRVIAVADNGDVYLGGGGEVLRIDAGTGVLSVVAGRGHGGFSGDGGPALEAGMPSPSAIALDGLGNLIVAHYGHRIRYVNLGDVPVTVYPEGPDPVTVDPGSIRTIVGNGDYARGGDDGDGGAATAASITSADNLGIASDGDLLFAQDDAMYDGAEDRTYVSMLVRRVDWETGIIETVAGNKQIGAGGEDVPARAAPFAYPSAAFEHGGDVLVVDRGNTRIRRVGGDRVRTDAGAGIGDGLPATRAQLCWPEGVASEGGVDYVSDGCNVRVRAVGQDGTITTVAGSDPPCVMLGWSSYQCGTPHGDGGPAAQAGFADPRGIAASGDGLLATISGWRIRVVNVSDTERTIFPDSTAPIVLSPGEIEYVAGEGDQLIPPTGSIEARGSFLEGPQDVSFAPDDDMVIAETGGHRILRIDSGSGQISVVAGAVPATRFDRFAHLDGPAAAARFFLPGGVAVASDGAIYVADTANARIRRIDPLLGVVTTVAGSYLHGFAGDGGPATSALLAYPEGISIAPDGALIVADTMNHRIRRIDPDTGIITTLAGSGSSAMDTLTCGSKYPCGHYAGDGGLATEARLYLPSDAVVTDDGRLLIADTLNNRVRVVSLS